MLSPPTTTVRDNGAFRAEGSLSPAVVSFNNLKG